MNAEGEPLSADDAALKTLKTAVRRFWDAKPCGVKNTALIPGSRAFYEAIEAHRYKEESQIPDVVDFDQSAGKRVLEIGGGVGTDGRQFARNCGQYVDADLSINSLQLARDGFRCFGLSGMFVNADAENLPFPDASFDLVYSHGVLHHTPDTERALGEAYRVLRPEGRAVIMLYARESFQYWVGTQTVGRLRLEAARLRMGRIAFNEFVGLPSDHRGWLPDWLVVNNSTDGLGNPLSKLYTKRQLREMFSAYRQVSLQKHCFPLRKIPLLRNLMPRSIAYHLGRSVGSFWYVIAVK